MNGLEVYAIVTTTIDGSGKPKVVAVFYDEQQATDFKDMFEEHGVMRTLTVVETKLFE